MDARIKTLWFDKINQRLMYAGFSRMTILKSIRESLSYVDSLKKGAK